VPVLVVAAVAGLPLVVAMAVARRERVRRNKLDRHGLDQLRRIYRRDNPRGSGLDPLIRDQQQRVRPRP
jgi:hypothetical protein